MAVYDQKKQGSPHGEGQRRSARTRAPARVGAHGPDSATAILANLPSDFLEKYQLNPNYLIAALSCTVIFGLFLYLRFFFFLAVVLLIAGANMPSRSRNGSTSRRCR